MGHLTCEAARNWKPQIKITAALEEAIVRKYRDYAARGILEHLKLLGHPVKLIGRSVESMYQLECTLRIQDLVDELEVELLENDQSTTSSGLCSWSPTDAAS